MIEISPIGNPDDILRDAQRLDPPKPEPQPPTTDTHDPIETYGLGQMGPTVPPAPVPLASDAQVPPPIVRLNSGPPPVEPATLNSDKPFSYPLPVFSYVLVWFYLVISVLAGYNFIQTSIQYSSKMSTYDRVVETSSSSTSASGASFAATLQKTADAQKEAYQKVYVQSIIKSLVTVAVGVAMVFLLLSGRKLFRLVALGIAVAVVGYEVYSLIQVIVTASNNGSASESLVTFYINAYLPFIVLPVATIVHLMHAKARQAYK